MATIKNETKLPLKVPLPGGKALRLQPGKTGEVGPKALEHPPLAKLVESGDLAVLSEGRSRGAARASNRGVSDATGHDPDRTIRKTGDG